MSVYNCRMNAAGKWKLAATVLALVPAGFFLLFAVGEGIEGWSHYLQVALVFLPMLLGWRYPRVIGGLFIALGGAFAVWYPITVSHFPLATIALVEIIISIPVVGSGVCYLRAARGMRQ